MQGAVVVIGGTEADVICHALSEGGAFSVARLDPKEPASRLRDLSPAAVMLSQPDIPASLIETVTKAAPYTPLLAIGPAARHHSGDALPFTAPLPQAAERLRARLRSAIRVRALHDTIMRRQSVEGPTAMEPDPLEDASVLLVGRASSYPALSMAAGERLGVIGSLSVEAAARHLNSRDLDGVIVGEGFSGRVIDAFLMVLSEDARFRNLPVIAVGSATGVRPDYDLPNLELIDSAPADAVRIALPLIRQQAFEARLNRQLKSIEAGGLLDIRTGLLTPDAFARDFHRVVTAAAERGAGLSVARFSFEGASERVAYDAARIMSRLMRKVDFAVRGADNSIVVAFNETDLSAAHVIARRLASVLRHTMLSASERERLAPDVTLATLRSGDTAQSLLARLADAPARAAS